MPGWQYKDKDGHIVGPIPARRLSELVGSGRLSIHTPVLHSVRTKGKWILAHSLQGGFEQAEKEGPGSTSSVSRRSPRVSAQECADLIADGSHRAHPKREISIAAASSIIPLVILLAIGPIALGGIVVLQSIKTMRATYKNQEQLFYPTGRSTKTTPGQQNSSEEVAKYETLQDAHSAGFLETPYVSRRRSFATSTGPRYRESMKVSSRIAQQVGSRETKSSRSSIFRVAKIPDDADLEAREPGDQATESVHSEPEKNEVSQGNTFLLIRGAKLRNLMKEHQVSREQLASEAGLAVELIDLLTKSEQQSVGKNLASKIATAIGASAADLQ